MAKHQSAFSNWSVYLVARVVTTLLQMLPLRLLEWAGGAMGTLFYLVSAMHRKRALANLAQAFPERRPDEHKRIAHASARHFVRVALEVFINHRLVGPTNWQRHVAVTEPIETILSELKAGQPAILVTGHHGNWELMGYAIAMRGLGMHAIARPIDNPLINDWLVETRARRGLKLIDKDGASSEAMYALEAGEVLGIVADQNAGKRGIYVPFFNRLASTHKSIALLAIQYQAPIYCGFGKRLGEGYQFEVHCHDIIRPEEWADVEDPVYYITARWVHAIEEMVRDDPEQYLWMHRRWRTRPRFEKEQKPIPPSLMKKLRSLPWVDDAMIERLATGVTDAK